MQIPGFTDDFAETEGGQIAYSHGGDGPPVLLLHGFPQTRAMWREIAPVLARRFTVIAADLRGYGDSVKPGEADQMTFRHMADDQAQLMAALGFDRFHLAGHDRGARTAHRLALDFPARVASLTVMDIVPTHLLLSELTHDVAKAYYHWFFLAQPSPLPERMIAADPDAYFESCLLGWGGSALSDFNADALAAYRTSWRRPETIAAMCDDYRAAIQFDMALDQADLDRTVNCPALVLWGADGIMAQAFEVPETWAPRLSNMQSTALPGGHFFPESAPRQTADVLYKFLSKV